MRPKNGAQTPSPTPGAWSGSMPTDSPRRRVRTPCMVAGTALTAEVLRAVSSTGASAALRGGRNITVMGIWRAR
ncbi:Uncharacterised protein [Bordetella pertussis]|nr:Uncharacterised protein [Bordetella pertussis]CPO07885.1 Uncharacterised protein [Bordetella pertussis]